MLQLKSYKKKNLKEIWLEIWSKEKQKSYQASLELCVKHNFIRYC